LENPSKSKFKNLFSSKKFRKNPQNPGEIHKKSGKSKKFGKVKKIQQNFFQKIHRF
jgi:hypothetical protein